MNDIISVQLAISKLHLQSMISQPPSDAIATQAVAELNTALAELEAVNSHLQDQNDQLAQVTEAREIEAERYRSLFENVPVPYVVTDGWGIIEEANAAAEDLLNVRRDMLRGKPISVFVAPAERREFREYINNVAEQGARDAVFQPRGGERITVHLDISEIPYASGTDRRLGWVIQNLTPRLAAASAEKMLARETALRLESQAAVLRLRSLHVGLETMAHDAEMPIQHRITSLLEALVPRFANQMSCCCADQPDLQVTIGSTINATDHVLQTLVIGPNLMEARVVARRSSPFTPEDGAILQSVANGVSLLLYTSARITQTSDSGKKRPAGHSQ
jgi:PAS domain S-box-containing protein